MSFRDLNRPWYVRALGGAGGGVVVGTLLAIPMLLLGLGGGGRFAARSGPDAPGLFVVVGIILGWTFAGAMFGLIRPAFRIRWLAIPAGIATFIPLYLGYASARRLAGEPIGAADDLAPAVIAAAVVGGAVGWALWRDEARRANGKSPRRPR